MNKRTKTALRRWCLYGWTFAKWTMAASAIGVVCGLIGTMFHFGVHEVTAFRGTHPWVLYLLPLAGFVIVSFYKLTETDGLGTDDIIDAVHEGKRLPILLLPAIFFGTVLTHLCGGSAGREGAALQMGGTIGQCMGRTFRLDDRDLRVATLAGMAAFFSALFGTPLAATVFAIMVISIGVLYHVALYPSLLAALVAYGVSVRLGVEPTRFTVAVPDQSVGMFVRVAALGVLCAWKEERPVDRILCKVGTVTSCIPEFWLSLVLILVFSVALRWLPSSGAYAVGGGGFGDRLRHLVLPMTVVVLSHLWYYAYMLRNKLLEEVRADYVLLARAKGLSRRTILLRHCLRNALPSYLSLMAISVPHILGGTYVVETVFSYPGIGTLAYESARYKDYNLLMVLCILTGAVVILCSIAAQIINERLDPRIRADVPREEGERT